MTFDAFQQEAMATAIYADELRLIYPALGLAGETGEVLEKIKKVYRDDNGQVSDEKRLAISHELGDVLWYVAAVCRDLDISMSDCSKLVIQKLRSRAARGTLKGSGDER